MECQIIIFQKINQIILKKLHFKKYLEINRNIFDIKIIFLKYFLNEGSFFC